MRGGQGRAHQARHVSEWEVVGRDLFETSALRRGPVGRDRGKMEACNHGWGQVKMVAGGVGVTQPGLGDSVYTKEEGGVSSQRQGNEGFGS